MKHVAGKREPQVRETVFSTWSRQRSEKKTLKSIHCHGGAEQGHKDLRAAELQRADFATPMCVKPGKAEKELSWRKDKIRPEGEISAAASSLLTDGT